MQNKRTSLIEAATNTCIGFSVSYLVYMHLLPVWGLNPTATQAIEITAVFAFAGLLRGYLVRRLFNLINNMKREIIERAANDD